MTATKHRRRRHDLDPREQARRLSNFIRLLAFAVAAGIVLAGIGLALFPPAYLLGVAGLLAYPLLAQALLVMGERRDLRIERAAPVLMQVDAAIIGVVCALLHFAVIPCLVLLIIVHANSVSSGGLRAWLLNLLSTAAGAGLGLLLLEVPPRVTTVPLSLSVVSLVGLGLHVGATSFFTNRQTRILRQAQERVHDQQRQAVELSRKLAKYLPPQVWGSLFSGQRDAKLETRRKRLTIFFSDIRGFSTVSEELPLDALTKMLNTYLSEMTRIALRYGGTVDKFIGDAVMVFFGDPKSAGAQEDAYRCVAMAVEMQEYMRFLRLRWRRQGIDQKLEIRIGINTGFVTVGNFGTDSRMDYTILGTDVNLASRLESACRPGQVLISESTYGLVKERVRCRSVGEIQVKGFHRPITVYEAHELKRNAGSKRRFVTLDSPGLGLHMDLERIHNFDKKAILKALARCASELGKDKPVDLEYETEGFALYVESKRLREGDREKAVEMLGQAARRIQDRVRI
ncbi:adenylate/guanylate cyclase domain-containing protein [Alloalcanivorax gelatiniphagus]|uniref:Adenylate cyclase n=1 Tax=Alloalcanivorax gelatiniphagus TaxID=1194167 RepID=A0ABY2XL51_9GAMM|nr:adenylate/guanylate cyclase domain-containing protein [Alloalcanivorax gelatiniphagus]TMW12845.1 adenylate cyclase [Alloalcanivorax gelatiniphagus]